MEQRELPTEEKQDKGFTLIELLIVIVILGILATVTVLAVNGITNSAKENSCETERATVETAIEAYYVQHSATYPIAASAVTANAIPGLDSTYMKPVSSENAAKISYSSTANGSSYTLTDTCSTAVTTTTTTVP